MLNGLGVLQISELNLDGLCWRCHGALCVGAGDGEPLAGSDLASTHAEGCLSALMGGDEETGLKGDANTSEHCESADTHYMA